MERHDQQVLVERAQDGDRAAFTELLKSNDNKMRALSYRMMGSASAMDDVLQDAYLKAYRSLGTFRSEAAFSTWLYAIVYRTSLDALRKRGRRQEVGLHLVGEAPSTEANAEQRLTDLSAMQSLLAELPPEQRAAVLLVDGEALSYAEAAQILDIAPGTVASRLNRARQTLRGNVGLPAKDTER